MTRQAPPAFSVWFDSWPPCHGVSRCAQRDALLLMHALTLRAPPPPPLPVKMRCGWLAYTLPICCHPTKMRDTCRKRLLVPGAPQLIVLHITLPLLDEQHAGVRPVPFEAVFFFVRSHGPSKPSATIVITRRDAAGKAARNRYMVPARYCSTFSSITSTVRANSNDISKNNCSTTTAAMTHFERTLILSRARRRLVGHNLHACYVCPCAQECSTFAQARHVRHHLRRNWAL